MRRTVRDAAVLLLMACAGASSALAADSPPPAYVQAQRAEADGEYARAEKLYGEALVGQADYVPALMGRARMRSWLEHFPEAIRDYRRVVQLEPGNVQAQSGLAWTLGWNGNYDEARRIFDRLLSTEPYYLDAQKGIAYIELWRGNAASARRWFEALASEDQGNPDYVLAIAQAAYLQGDYAASRRAYRQALELQPGFEAARSGLQAVETALVERRPQLTILGGRSEGGDVTKSGLRFAQLAVALDRSLRLWVAHDRGVGEDGVLLDRRLEQGSTTSVGGFWNYTPRLAAKLEVGQRKLLDEHDAVVSAEQVFFLPHGTTPKVGIWWADASGGNQWVLSAGVHRWITPRFALEPTLYLGESGETKEKRGALLGTLRFGQRAQAGLGFAYGNKDTPLGNRSVDRIFGNLELPIGLRAKFLLYGWREATEGTAAQTVIAAGFAVHL